MEIWVTTMSMVHFSVFPFLGIPRELEEYMIVFVNSFHLVLDRASTYK